MNEKLTTAAQLVARYIRELNRDPELTVRECLGRLRLLTAHDVRIVFRDAPNLLQAATAVLAATDAEIETVSRAAR